MSDMSAGPSLILDKAQEKKEVSTFENSFHDYGSNFGLYQLGWFSLSVIGLTLYFLHYIASTVVESTSSNDDYDFPLLHRTTADALLEVMSVFKILTCMMSHFLPDDCLMYQLFVLVGRGGNEIYFGKWSAGDAVHHIGVILGTCLVFFNQHCKPFAWLVCQLNSLHYPMFIWYVGCRKNCFSTSLRVQSVCKSIFPPLWLMVSAYRLSCLMLSAGWAWWRHGNVTAGVSGAVFAVILGYLDKNWTDFFLEDLRAHTMKQSGDPWQYLDVGWMHCVGVMFGFMTVFYF